MRGGASATPPWSFSLSAPRVRSRLSLFPSPHLYKKRLTRVVFATPLVLSPSRFDSVVATLSSPTPTPTPTLFVVGTGKTELAKSIANVLLGAPTAVVRVDMAEFQEKHSVSKFLGAPSGYTGALTSGCVRKGRGEGVGGWDVGGWVDEGDCLSLWLAR